MNNPKQRLENTVSIAEPQWPHWLTVLVLAALIWVARYWYSSSFGLYEDDFGRVVPAIDSSWPSLWTKLWTTFAKLGDQGRLFHHNFIMFFSWLGYQFGDLPGIYRLGFVILTLNTVLFYFLLRKVCASPAVVTTAAVAYALFPVDTTPAYLTMTFGGQTSLTFFLLASFCYLAGRKRKLWLVPAYLLAFCSLTCYETVFLLFLAVPLLDTRWDRKLFWEMVRHGAILGAMMVSAVLIRKSMGEGFVSGLDYMTALTRPFRQMWIGPWTSLSMMLRRPVDAFTDHGIELAAFLAPAFVGLLFFFRRLWSGGDGSRVFSSQMARLGAAGFLMLVMAYPLTFTVPASVIDGRGTRVHLAAVPGAAIVAAVLVCALAHVLGRSRLRYGIPVLLAVITAGQLGFLVLVQHDYTLSWQRQQAFWRDLIKLCPDLEDKTVIVMSQQLLLESRQIFSWGWTTPYMLRNMFEFPSEWKNAPLVYLMHGQWQEMVAKGDHLYDGVNAMGWKLEGREDANFVLLHVEDGRLVRQREPLVVGDNEFTFKEQSTEHPPPFATRTLYRYMIGAPLDSPVNYVKREGY